MIEGKREIIIVDQKAPDEVGECFKRLPNIQYFNLETPGMVAARNFGITQAKYEIILFVDDDIKPDLNLIDGHLSAYTEEQVGGVAGRILEENCNNIVLHVDPRSLDPIHGWKYTHFDHLDSIDVMTVRGCNMSFRKELLLQIGGFDTNLLTFRDDSDVSFRIRALGYRIAFEPTAELLHLSASSGGTRPTEQQRNFVKNELLMYRQHFCHYRDNLLFLCKHFSGRVLLINIFQAYVAYVGISRYPWRIIIKNFCFFGALIQSAYRAKIDKPPYFSTNTSQSL